MQSSSEKAIEVRQLLTHFHPDLDATFAIYLLRKHGDRLLPGASSAEIAFASANCLPDGKSSEQLESEGVIAVDIGGGRFDNHPIEGKSNSEKWDSCASKLVAEALGVDKEPAYRFLLPFTRAQDSEGRSLTSKDPGHHLLAPHSLLEGLHRVLENDTKVVDYIHDLYDGIAIAAAEDEPPLKETAERFDRTLAEYLRREEKPVDRRERKEPLQFDAEGASHVLARDDGEILRRDLEKLLMCASRTLAGSDGALPKVELERRVLLPSALNGLAKIHGDGSDEYFEHALPLIAAAVKREKDWFDAIDEVKRSAKKVWGRNFLLIAVASRNGLVIKAARYKRGGDAVLYYNPGSGAVTLQSGQKRDGTPLINLRRAAARIRTADAMKREHLKPVKDADKIGMVGGWFLHPSLKLLNCGSQKAPEVEPSALDWREIIEIVRGELRPEEKLPDDFCPPDHCTESRCLFYPLRLVNCHTHRGNLREKPQKGTLGELFDDKLKKLK